MTSPPTSIGSARTSTPSTPKPSPGAGLCGSALVVLLLGMALPVTDFFVVNVALPTMGRDLHASNGVLELVVSGYGLAYAMVLVLGGRLGDAIGRRRMFLIGMAGFTLFSAACGLAPSAAALIAGRVLQGVAAGLMVPQVLATIQARTEGERRARAVGRYGATAGIGMVAGQVLGGAIVALNVAGTGWRGIFLVNVPLGIVGLITAARTLPESRSDRPTSIDVGGTALLAAALLCLLLPLSQGQALGWPTWTWVLLALAPPAAVAFAAYERAYARRGATPLVPPLIVGQRSVRAGLTIAVPFFVSFGGFMFVYAVATQDALHLGPLPAGAALAPFALAFFAASLLSARAVSRFGHRVMQYGAAVQGLALLGVAAVVVPSWPHVPLAAIEPVLVVMGFAQGLVVSPLFRLVLSDVPSHLAGAGAGVLTTTQQASLALGVALLGTLYTSLSIGSGGARAAGTILVMQAAIAGFVSFRSARLGTKTASGSTAGDELALSVTESQAA